MISLKRINHVGKKWGHRSMSSDKQDSQQVDKVTNQSLRNLQQSLSDPRFSISGSRKQSFSSKYGSMCQGKTDIGSDLRQQLQYEGFSADSHEWKFLEAMNLHKISKDYQEMGSILKIISENNVRKFRNAPDSLTEKDIIHMKSYIHHIQNPRYGLYYLKKEPSYQHVKDCLLACNIERNLQ